MVSSCVKTSALCVLLAAVLLCLSSAPPAFSNLGIVAPPHSGSTNPVCALKTLSAGYGYIPDPTYVGVTTFMRIEELYTDPKLAADGFGGTSYSGYVSYTWPNVYMGSTDYPDGKINLQDLMGVGVRFGTWEGGKIPRIWTYMADAVPDRKVDLKDYFMACRNFGHAGTYIWPYTLGTPPTWNLPPAAVSVTFDIGGSYDPFSLNGFVPVPSGSTSFTITYGGSVGAVVTFWP